MKLTLVVCCLAIFVVCAVRPVRAQVAGRSTTCGEVNGKAKQDLERLIVFCEKAVPADLDISGAIAMETLLWVRVTRPLANMILKDRLTAEGMIRGWMTAWKALTSSRSVTVTVEWDNVKVAEGQTSAFSGDHVTFHQ